MKQTEIDGVADTLIPDDWEVKRLGDSVDILRGGSPRPIENYLTTNADGINWIKIGDVKPNDKYIRKTEEKIIPEGKSRSREVKKGDFILSNSMSFGRPYILAIDGCIHDGWLTIQKYAETFDKEFLYYLLGSDEVFNQYVQMAAGSSVQNLNKDKVADLQLKIPPLPEQQRIAKALSDVDALISTTEKLIQKKKNIKQGAMQNLLTGKKRLPGFGDKQTDLFVPNDTHTKEVKDVSPEQIRLSAKMKQTELGEIPEDWEVKNINKECTIKARIGWQGLKSTEYLDSGDYILITGTDFDSGFINWKSCSYVTKWRFDQDKNIQIKQGDVLITKDGTIGKVAFLNEIPMQGTLNSGVFVIRPKNPDKMDSVFLSLIFKSFWFDSFLEQITSGSTIVHLYQKDFVKFNFPLPSKEEQTAIANVLSSMDKEIETLNTKLEKYRNLKTAMMQQLLTGKIRLK